MYFIMHPNYEEYFQMLDADQTKILVMALFAFCSRNEILETEDKLLKMCFLMITENITKGKNKKSVTSAVNGAKGGRPKKDQEPIKNLAEPKKAKSNVVKPDLKNLYSELSPPVVEVFEAYLDVRKSLKMKETERTIKLLVNKLVGFNDNIKIEMINQSIERNYRSIFKLNSNNNINKEPTLTDMSMEQIKSLGGDPF